MILPSVFVHIPTPTQSVGRQDEIKAEPPIKSEIDNANQLQAVVASKSTKDSSSSTPKSSNITTEFSSSTSTDSNLTANLVTARPKVKCLRCEQCPFMSISQDGYNNHIRSVHNNESSSETASNRSFRSKILCPGCENVFYSEESLRIHLVNDHQMSQPDISQLLESLSLKKNASNRPTTNEKSDDNIVTSPPKEKGSEKQKIYLRNVEVLQNPRFNPCEFDVQNTPPTILSPSETQSECSSSLADEITNNDPSIELNYNRMQAHTSFNQLDSNNLYQHITSIETSAFPTMVTTSQSLRNECLSENHERMPMNAISPIIATIDDAQTNRPDSGNSIKFSDNFMNTENIWTTDNVTTNADGFSFQSHDGHNQLPSIKIASNSGLNVNQVPLVSPTQSLPMKERKKIYIKNIDILKEPLIKPTQTVSLAGSSCRKNTLHLRTVDEVNLLIKPHENNTFNSVDGEALNEDEYRYVLNDASEYNNIIPQYLESDVNDFMFSSEPQIAPNPVEYYNGGSNSNYAITNLDSNVQNYPAANNTSTFDSAMYASLHTTVSICNGMLGNIPNTDLFQMNHNNINLNGPAPSDDYLDFGNKCMPMKALDSTDYMIVSSEEIIDILDLTNDEVEQILDDNMISPQDFDALNSPRLLQTSTQSFNRLPRINLASNLTRDALSSMGQNEGKTIEMRSLETPTINLDSANTETENECETIETVKTVINDQVAAVKKKSGRTKGARQINGITNRNAAITTKCSVSNCGIRFATQAAIQLHEQCHSADGTEIRCPKCEIDPTTATISSSASATLATTAEATATSTVNVSSSNPTNDSDSAIATPSRVAHNRNWNWNTLHTHLWREHSIDMELYSCPHCSFKTPILSRLKNTHMKIHSDSRDFKCDFCSKAFKNARQMKNHRRIHTRSTPPTISQCKYCGQSFYSAKHLKEHYLTHNEAIEHQRQPFALQCDICSETFSSKHALRAHHLNHFEEKRFNCDECDYKSNDHNAFRRHQMVHSKAVKYKCQCCAFQCIQSTNYKTHILKNHPESAKELMFMCDKCNFVTVNKRMYDMHCLNHNNNQMSSVELD